MRKRGNEPSFKCLSDGYTLDSLRVYCTGDDTYLIRALISGRWILCADITKTEYNHYRATFYTDPAGAKNYLLDMLPWDDYPFTRDTFRFVENGKPLSKNSFYELMQFVASLELDLYYQIFLNPKNANYKL